MSRCPCEPSSRNRLLASRAGRTAAGLGRTVLAGVTGIVLAAAAGEAAADEVDAGPITPPVELRHDRTVDVAVTAGLAASNVTVLLVRDEIHPKECRWCDGRSPGDLNAVDDWFRTALRRPDSQPADLTSHILAFGAAPLAAGGLTVLASVADRRGEGAVTDLILVAQGTLTATLATEVLKPIFARPRPNVHAIADDDARREAASVLEDLRSFPSGHTSAVFGMAAASGMVATMRGYRLAPLVWAAGIMLGVSTAYARMAADRHYFTDTLGGAAVGFVFGGGVPLLFHPPASKPGLAGRIFDHARLTTSAVPGGRTVSLAWAF